MRRWLRQHLLLGQEPSPELFAILLVYLVQGVLGLARLASTFFLKDDLHLHPSEVAALSGIQILPWTIKPLYGFLSDTLPLFGYRRRSYLILSGALGASAWMALGTWADTPFKAVLCATVASLAVAVSDVVADGIVVERVRHAPQEQAGSLQSLCWGTSALGGLVSAYFSGSLLESMTPRQVFRITALFPLLVALVAGSIREQRTSDGRRGAGPRGRPFGADALALLRNLWQAVRQPSVFYPALFVVLWQSTPSSDTAFFYYLTNELHFQPEFLGRVRLLSSAAMLAGVVLYNQFLKRQPIKEVLRWSTIVSVPLGLTQLLLITHANQRLGIPDAAFALGDAAILTVLGQVAFMPTLVLAARLCPPGAESVVFATLMSLNNASAMVGTELGALFTQLFGVTETRFDNLAALVLFCNLSSLLPLFAIDFLDRAPIDQAAENVLADAKDDTTQWSALESGEYHDQQYAPSSPTAADDASTESSEARRPPR